MPRLTFPTFAQHNFQLNNSSTPGTEHDIFLSLKTKPLKTSKDITHNWVSAKLIKNNDDDDEMSDFI